MKKRAQASLFVIIAILIVAVILFIVFLTKNTNEKITDQDIAKVKAYVQDCLQTKTNEGVDLIAKQGGYYKIIDNGLNFLEERTVYYLKNNQILIPTQEKIKQELDSALEDKSKACLQMQDYSLTSESCIANSEIDEEIEVIFNCPITLKKGSSTTRIEGFYSQVDFSVPEMLNLSSQIANEYKKDPKYLCITCLDQIAAQKNITITAVPITNSVGSQYNATWFLINSTKKMGDQYIIWRFATELK
jgi:hypothetical protein